MDELKEEILEEEIEDAPEGEEASAPADVPSEAEEAVEEGVEEEEQIDYAALVENDLAQLRAAFPEAAGIKDVTELKNPIRYGALRDLGLSPKEAYLATEGIKRRDGRSHLVGAFPKAARAQATTMTRRELESARLIFGNLNDRQIERLYKKVTG